MMLNQHCHLVGGWSRKFVCEHIKKNFFSLYYQYYNIYIYQYITS